MCTGMEPGVAFALSAAMTAATTGLSLYSQSEQVSASYEYQQKMAAINASSYRQQMENANANVQRQINYQNAMIDSQNAMFLDVVDAANDAYTEEAAILSVREMEEEEATSDELMDIQRAARERVGQAMASNQTTGMSMDGLLRDIKRQEARYKDASLANLGITKRQIAVEKEGLKTKAERTINGFTFNTPSPITPNWPTYNPTAFQEQTVDWGGAIGNMASGITGDYFKFATKVYNPETKKYTFQL